MRGHQGVDRSLDWGRVDQSPTCASKASLARAWLECPGQQGLSGVRMSESVLWTEE